MARQIHYIGRDDFGRDLFTDNKGNYYCDINLDMARRTGDFSTIDIKSPSWSPYGEPSHHVDVELYNRDDTPISELPSTITADKGGYYFYDDDQNQLTPQTIYFGIDFWQNDAVGGMAYCHYKNVLRPVYNSYGLRVRYDALRGVICDYDKEKHELINFRKE